HTGAPDLHAVACFLRDTPRVRVDPDYLIAYGVSLGAINAIEAVSYDNSPITHLIIQSIPDTFENGFRRGFEELCFGLSASTYGKTTINYYRSLLVANLEKYHGKRVAGKDAMADLTKMVRTITKPCLFIREVGDLYCPDDMFTRRLQPYIDRDSLVALEGKHGRAQKDSPEEWRKAAVRFFMQIWNKELQAFLNRYFCLYKISAPPAPKFLGSKGLRFEHLENLRSVWEEGILQWYVHRLKEAWDAMVVNGPPADIEQDYMQTIGILMDELGVMPSDRVFDGGTGFGYCAIEAAGRGATVVASDLSQKQLEAAARKAQGYSVTESIQFLQHDFVAGLPRDDFDHIILGGVIEAFPKWMALRIVQAMYRDMKPGASIGIQTHCGWRTDLVAVGFSELLVECGFTDIRSIAIEDKFYADAMIIAKKEFDVGLLSSMARVQLKGDEGFFNRLTIDRKTLNGIMQELVDNALKAQSEGDIIVELDQQDDRATIRVINEGEMDFTLLRALARSAAENGRLVRYRNVYAILLWGIYQQVSAEELRRIPDEELPFILHLSTNQPDQTGVCLERGRGLAHVYDEVVGNAEGAVRIESKNGKTTVTLVLDCDLPQEDNNQSSAIVVKDIAEFDEGQYPQLLEMMLEVGQMIAGHEFSDQEAACYTEHLRRDILAGIDPDAATYIKVVVVGGVPVGYVNALFNEKWAFITAIGVIGDRRRGLGRRLLERCVEDAFRSERRKIVTSTSDTNAGARAFFKRHGFKETSISKQLLLDLSIDPRSQIAAVLRQQIESLTRVISYGRGVGANIDWCRVILREIESGELVPLIGEFESDHRFASLTFKQGDREVDLYLQGAVVNVWIYQAEVGPSDKATIYIMRDANCLKSEPDEKKVIDKQLFEDFLRMFERFRGSHGTFDLRCLVGLLIAGAGTLLAYKLGLGGDISSMVDSAFGMGGVCSVGVPGMVCAVMPSKLLSHSRQGLRRMLNGGVARLPAGKAGIVDRVSVTCKSLSFYVRPPRRFAAKAAGRGRLTFDVSSYDTAPRLTQPHLISWSAFRRSLPLSILTITTALLITAIPTNAYAGYDSTYIQELMQQPKAFIGLVAAGMIGVLIRFGILYTVFRSRKIESFISAGTLIANVLGTLMLGIITGATVEINDVARMDLAVGLCGALTTFSGLMLDSYRLYASGRYSYLVKYLAMTVGLGYVAYLLGGYIAQWEAFVSLIFAVALPLFFLIYLGIGIFCLRSRELSVANFIRNTVMMATGAAFGIVLRFMLIGFNTSDPTIPLGTFM
ncbi:GNAT family N-acetyltransferase, partial [Candidatus Omnitrophota bacterium]